MGDYHFTLKSAREYAGLSQPEAASLLGVHRTTVSNWERGKTVPRIDDIMKVSKVYGVRQEDIILPCYSTKSSASGEEGQ